MGEHKLYMAPMKGFTDRVFRNVFAEHFGGFDLAVAPFISSKKDTKIKRNYVKDLWPEHNTRLPVVPQILSKTAHDFTLLANYLHDVGYESVNWNLGCPSPMVANKKRGAGMLPHTDLIHAFLDHALAGMKGTLSIKIRLGWQDPEDILRLMPILNQYPLAALIIHPRTGVQRYEGRVDLEAFAGCVAMIKHPVIYNGDIRTLEDFRKLSKRFSRVSGWMIGRGALADPFLPRSIKAEEDNISPAKTDEIPCEIPDDIPDKIKKMQAFHTALFDGYRTVLDGPAHVLDKMKGFWGYFSMPYQNGQKIYKRIKRVRDPDRYIDLVNTFFETEAKLMNS